MKIVHIFKNYLFMLKFALLYGRLLVVCRFLFIFLETLVVYVNINVTRWIFDSIEMNKNMKDILTLIIIFASFCIVANLSTSWFHIRKSPVISISITRGIINRVVQKVKQIDQINFEDKVFYDKYSRGLNETSGRVEAIVNSICNTMSAILQTITIVGVTSLINKNITICGYLAAILGTVITYFNNKIDYNQNVANTTNQRKMDYIKRLIYIPEFTKDMKLYDRFIDLLLDQYNQSTDNYKKVIREYSLKKYIIHNILSVSNILLVTIIPWIIIINLLYERAITIPEATVLLSSSIALPNTIKLLLNSTAEFSLNSWYVDNLRAILDYRTNIEKEEGNSLTISEGISIKFKNVNFSYSKNENLVLQNLNLNINDCEKVAIVGFNGAGKTTLTKLISRIYETDSGEIYINDINIKTINVKSIRNHISVLSQDFNIYSFTIAENILMRSPSCSEDYQIIDQALKQVGLYDKVSLLPKGVHSYITKEFEEDGIYLSGGELQKLAWARLYVSDAKCVIMDEPTSSLDPISEHELTKKMMEIFHDKTLIIISHRLSIVKDVDKIVYLSDKHIMEQGSHKQLYAMRGKYYNLYIIQANKYKDLI